MTRPAPTPALRRQFGLPVILSVALHGLAVAALGTVQLAPPVLPIQSQRTTVDLVTLPPEPVAEPVVSPVPQSPQPVLQKVSVREVRHKAVKRISPRPVSPTRKYVQSVMNTSMPPAGAVASPLFKELPRVPAPASPPNAVFGGAAIFSLPESVDSPVLLNAKVDTASINRPLPTVSSGGTKLLRDSTTEMGSVRSKVRAGDNPRPEYPRAAREAGWEGTVILRVLVLPDGTAGSVTLLQTSGHSILDEAALSAVKKWRFIPAMDGHFPIQSAVHLPIRFDLKAAN